MNAGFRDRNFYDVTNPSSTSSWTRVHILLRNFEIIWIKILVEPCWVYTSSFSILRSESWKFCLFLYEIFEQFKPENLHGISNSDRSLLGSWMGCFNGEYYENCKIFLFFIFCKLDRYNFTDIFLDLCGSCFIRI